MQTRKRVFAEKLFAFETSGKSDTRIRNEGYFVFRTYENVVKFGVLYRKHPQVRKVSGSTMVSAKCSYNSLCCLGMFVDYLGH